MSQQVDLSIPQGPIAYLAQTPYASARADPLSGGTTNFVFRLHLNMPYEGRTTLVLKHAHPYVARRPDFPLPVSRKESEVDALRRVRACLPADARVTVPAVHLFDSTNHAIVMDDAGPRTLTLKAALLAGRIAPGGGGRGRAAALGTALGAFLRDLHARGRADAALRSALGANEFAKKISGFITYGRLGATLRALDGEAGDEAEAGTGAAAAAAAGGAGDRALLASVLGDEPLGVSEDTLRVVEALAERRTAQINEARDEGFVMGDFWPGNVLVVVGEEDTEEEEGGKVLVVDWELARPGLPGLDVGQFCAELATLRRLRPERAQAAGEMLESFVRAYFAGDVGPEMDETRRIALGHFGVHLAVWTARTGWDGGAGPTRALVLDGVARLVEGADSESTWTDDELVQKFML